MTLDKPIIVTLVLLPGTPPYSLNMTANIGDKALIHQLLIAGAQEFTRQMAAEAPPPVSPTDTGTELLLPPGFTITIPKNPGCN